MSERLNLVVEDGTKAKLLDMAESERKLGELVSRLASAEHTRQTVSIESLAERVELLESHVSGMNSSGGRLAMAVRALVIAQHGPNAEEFWQQAENDWLEVVDAAYANAMPRRPVPDSN